MFLDTSYSGGTRIYFTVPAPATTPGRLPGQPEVIGAFTLPAPASGSASPSGGSGAGGPAEPGDENTGTIPEGTPHVRPGTDRSPAGRG